MPPGPPDRAEAAPPPGALAGVRVVETGGPVGAWCGRLLADMGAIVVKIEPPAGDVSRSYGPFYADRPHPEGSLFFWYYNAGKLGITLEPSSATGADLLRRLAAAADVVIDSSAPGALDRIGASYHELSRENPRLVMAAITPFGQDGPYRDYQSTDLTALAFGGPVWNCGYDDHSLPPVRGGGNQAWHTACHFATISILTALVHREVSGAGQFIDVNMHAALNVTTEAGTYSWLVARETVQRQTGRHAAATPTHPTQVLCRDGRYINTRPMARTEEEWLNLLAWLDEEGVVGNLRRYLSPPSRNALDQGDRGAVEQQAEVARAIQELAGKKDAYQLFRDAQERGLQWGIVYSPDEIMDDPHFQARGFGRPVEHPEMGRSFPYPGAPFLAGVTPVAVRRRAPLLGEHNEAVYLDELGLTPGDLIALREAGIV